MAWILARPAPSLAVDEPCLPRTPASVRRIAEDLGLDEDRIRGLVAAFRSGGNGWESEAGGIPLEIRDSIEAALCREAFARGQVLAGVSRRDDREERRAALQVEARALETGFRLRSRNDGTGILLRGGGLARAGGMTFAAGTIKVRHALGLVLETVGTEARGPGPRDPSSGAASVTLSADPAVARGAAWETAGRGWRAAILGSRIGRADGGAAMGALRLHRPGSRLSWSVAAVRGDGATAGSLQMQGCFPEGGAWAWEAAGGGGGVAWAATAGAGRGPWRFRAGGAWRGAGFRSPGAGRARAASDGALEASFEARRLTLSGRSFRVLWSEEREPDRDGFPRRQRVLEGEAAERLARGLQLSLLWRSKRIELPGPGSGRERAQEARGELRFARGGVVARVRLDDRVDAAGDGVFRLGVGRDRGAWAWDIRAIRVPGDPGEAAGVRAYVRRAGDASGWTTAPPGTTVGVWLRRRFPGWTIELSADGGAGRWTWAASLEHGLGGLLDPRGPRP